MAANSYESKGLMTVEPSAYGTQTEAGYYDCSGTFKVDVGLNLIAGVRGHATVTLTREDTDAVIGTGSCKGGESISWGPGHANCVAVLALPVGTKVRLDWSLGGSLSTGGAQVHAGDQFGDSYGITNVISGNGAAEGFIKFKRT